MGSYFNTRNPNCIQGNNTCMPLERGMQETQKNCLLDVTLSAQGEAIIWFFWTVGKCKNFDRTIISSRADLPGDSTSSV